MQHVRILLSILFLLGYSACYSTEELNLDLAGDFFFLARIQTQESLITWQNDKSVLQSILQRSSEYTLLKEEQADSLYLGTKYLWNSPNTPLALFFAQGEIQTGLLHSWHEIDPEMNECTHAENQATVLFKGNTDHFPFDSSKEPLPILGWIPKEEISIDSLKNIKGPIEQTLSVNGVDRETKGIDFNQDSRADIIWYWESLSETEKAYYILQDRNGQWKVITEGIFTECV